MVFSLRELLDKVKSWEDTELATQMMEKPSISPKKKLAPLTAEGPVQLLNIQICELGKENEELKKQITSLESQASSALNDKDVVAKKLGEELAKKEQELAEVAAASMAEKGAVDGGKHEEVGIEQQCDLEQ